MKILKRAEQRAVIINKEYYTRADLISIIKQVSCYGDYQLGFRALYRNTEYRTVDDIIELLSDRINIYEEINVYMNLTTGDKLEVALDEYGFYTNVIKRVNNDNSDLVHTIYIEL